MLLLGVTAWAQEFPRAEVGVDYSYARYAPSAPYSQGHSLNGGGGELNINFNEYLGIKMDLHGYGSNINTFNIAPNPTFPAGASGRVSGNLFTYLFGPQIKVRAHHFQPYGHLLFGGAHTNVYGNAFHTICQPIAGGCAFWAHPHPTRSRWTLAAEWTSQSKNVSIRPAQLDYLLTRFHNPFTGDNNQNNFRYSAGIVFSFGHTSY